MTIAAYRTRSCLVFLAGCTATSANPHFNHLPNDGLSRPPCPLDPNLRGGGWIPAGYHPFGYKISPLGKTYLELGGCRESDVGRLLAGLSSRQSLASLQTTWLEVVRVSKQKQAMRIYRTLTELIDFCLQAGLID